MASTRPDEAPVGAPDVAYGHYYYAHDCGLPYRRDEHWLGFFGKIADDIVRQIAPSSALDAGCAMGILVEQLLARGVDAWGIDVSEYAISNVGDTVASRCQVRSLTEPIEGRYDLITCIEVLEHLTPHDSRVALANICEATDQILFSSSPSDFGEPTHLNVLAPEAWSALFAEQGFFRNLDHDASYLTPWAALYQRRATETVADVVRAYDRSHVRLTTEVQQLRTSVLELQARFESGAATAVRDVDGNMVTHESYEQMQRRLIAAEQELMTLHDVVVHLEVQLGVALGEQELTHQELIAARPAAERLLGIEQSRSYRITERMMVPARRVRSVLHRLGR